MTTMHIHELERLFHYVLTGMAIGMIAAGAVFAYLTSGWEYLIIIFGGFGILSTRIELSQFVADKVFLWNYRREKKRL